VADEPQKIRRDALALSGLRASLQRRNARKRKTADHVAPEAEYLRINSGKPDGPEFTVFDGVRYRLEHSEVVTFWSVELKREVSYTAVRGIPEGYESASKKNTEASVTK
jgi:hypothetical protein